MDNRMELNLDAMEKVTGGVKRVVDTGLDGVNGVIRSGPSKSSAWVTSLPTGTVVDTVTDKLVHDDDSGRNFVQVNYTDKNGKTATGWIAASIIGMPR